MTASYLPPAPLLSLAESQVERFRSGPANDHELADVLGTSASAVRLWRLGKRKVAAATADRIATRLGRHPAELWPWEWTSAA